MKNSSSMSKLLALEDKTVTTRRDNLMLSHCCDKTKLMKPLLPSHCFQKYYHKGTKLYPKAVEMT